MDSILYALDLILVTGLCFWALREDSDNKRTNAKRKNKD